jgi:hypothetical protein
VVTAQQSEAEHNRLCFSRMKSHLIKRNADALIPLHCTHQYCVEPTKVSSPLSDEGLYNSFQRRHNGFSIQNLSKVTEIIQFPGFDPSDCVANSSFQTITLDEGAKRQLKDYVTQVAALYREHLFRNFELASHVTMSTSPWLES